MNYLWRIAPNEVDAEDFASPWECDGPPVVAVAELFGRDVSVQIASYWTCYNEREDVRVGTIRKPNETCKERHGVARCSFSFPFLFALKK